MISILKQFLINNIHNIQIKLFNKIKNFIIYGITTHIFNNNALIIASTNGYTEIVRLLLMQKDIDVNIQNIFFFQKYLQDLNLNF